MPLDSPSLSNPFGGFVQGILGPTARQRELDFEQQKFKYGADQANSTSLAGSKVTQKFGQLIAGGTSPTEAYKQILASPEFVDAMSHPNSDIAKVMTDLANQLNTMVAPQVKPNLGPGDAPVTQIPGQPPVTGKPNPTTDMQNQAAGLPVGSAGTTEPERARARLVAQGIIDKNMGDLIGADVLNVQPKQDQYGKTIGYDIVTKIPINGMVDPATGQPVTAGKTIKTVPATPETDAAFGPSPNTNPAKVTAVPQPVSPDEAGKVARRRAISAIESGGPDGNYKELGPVITNKNSPYFGDRAYGRYQVMGHDIPAWTKATTGKAMSVREFLDNPSVQDQVFDKFFAEAEAKYGGPDQAASVWFTGQPINPKSASASDRQQGFAGMSGGQYVQAFNDNLAKETGGKSPPGTSKGTAPLNWAPGAEGSFSPQGGPQRSASNGLPQRGVQAPPSADMFNAAGTLAQGIESVGKFLGGAGLDPSTAYEGLPADIREQESALDNYNFALSNLADNAKLSGQLKGLDTLRPQKWGSNPEAEAVKALKVFDLLTSAKTIYEQTINDKGASTEAKIDADQKRRGIEQVFATMPPRAEMEAKIKAYQKGTGGAYNIMNTLPKLVEMLKKGGSEVSTDINTVTGAKPAPAAAAPATKPAGQGANRVKEIRAITSTGDLVEYVRNANPPLSNEEQAVVNSQINALIRKGGK